MRPAILEQSFQFSNCVDLYNQSRRFDVVLEKSGSHSMLGMTVVDAWQIDRLVNAEVLTIK